MTPKVIRFVVSAGILAFTFMISVPLRAQVSGASLSGTISDPQGAAIPIAIVSVKNVATAVSFEVMTNAVGFYTVPNLTPGDYDVSVTAPGFSSAITKVTLTVGAKQEMNLTLTVGTVQEAIEVIGAAPLVETSTSTISGHVGGNEVRELPLNGRDWASLATLQPGVIEARTHLDVTHVGGGGGRGFGNQLSIGGGRPTQNSYRLDGALVNDYSNAGPGSVLGANLGVDAIQEFTVLTSNYSAEYGFTSGGVINAVTKSGTNTFHGSAFDFLRNDVFDATNFFNNANNLPKNPLRQNQFGASGGWRLLQDKTFLFGDYEGVRRTRGIPVTNGVTISDAVRSGRVVNLTTGALATVPAIDSNIQKFLSLYPHPAAGGPGCVTLPATQFSAPGVAGGCNPNIGRSPFQGTQTANENFYTFRGDEKLSDKDTLFATYLRDNSTFSSPLAFNNELQSFTSYRQSTIVEETHTFSAAWVNSVRVALSRTSNLGGNSPTVINPTAGDPSLGMNTPGITQGFFSPAIVLTGSGVTNLPGGRNAGASIQDFWGQNLQFYDDAFFTRGKHGLKLGFSFLGYQLDGYTPLANFNGSGTFTFQGLEPVAGGSTTVATAAEGPCYTGSGDRNSGNSYDNSCGTLINFLTDQPRAAARPFDSAAVSKQYLRDKIYSGYVQDDWRSRSNLTLNLGLRYEMATIPTEINGKVAIMPSPYTSLPCGPVTPGACPQPSFAASVPGDPSSVLRNSFWTHNPTTKNFEPRIGFAWDPFRNGKTAVRGGFGIFDALPLPYELILNNTSSAPWRSTLAAMGSAVLASPPSMAAGNAISTQGEWPYIVPSLTNVSVTNPINRAWRYLDNNIKRNYVYQYNFNIQRQLTSDTTLLVGYTGSRGIHNPFQADSVNTVLPTKASGGYYYWPAPWSGSLPGTGAVSQASRLLNPTTMAIMYNTMWMSRSWYNAFQVRLNKQMSHGFQVQGSFTYSKSIDDASGSTAGDTFQLDAVSEPWYDLKLDKGLSAFDVRRNLVVNSLWNVPAPKSPGGFRQRLLGGWQLGLITTLADGVPATPQIASDMLGEVITTVNSGNLVPGCSSQDLINPNYRHSLFYVNPSCISLVPRTDANSIFCDSAGRGFSAAVAANSCANIRGNIGRNTIIGPGLFNVDFSVFKNNRIPKISETANLQFRAEFFNILNRTNFAPTSNLSPFNANGTPNTLFGQLTSTQVDNRVIQFALKLVW
jgi:hypothetical protein